MGCPLNTGLMYGVSVEDMFKCIGVSLEDRFKLWGVP